jgi:glycosyltransferase involved in cell wall biosynthesis
MSRINFPINFAVLNGCASIAKGSKLLLKVMKLISERKLNDFFKLHIFGGLSAEVKDEILRFDNVVYHGSYNVNELNMILDEIEVGIIPSVWEEVYGYVGIEFLAKGIPVIGNKKGGIVDYTIDGFTGWVNKNSDAEGLVSIMTDIINNPSQVCCLNNKIINNRSRILKSMDQHFYEIDEIYRKLMSQS